MSSSTAKFDPYTQSFTLYQADGVTPFNLTVADIDSFNEYNMKVVTTWATQLGACIIMFALVLLITNPNKRKARLFWINLTSLALAIIRPVLQILFWTGPFNESFNYFAFDYSNVPRSAYANSIAATVVTFLLLCCVELSLFLQVQVITRAMMGDRYRMALLGFSGIIISLTLGFRFGQMVRNNQSILGDDTSGRWLWLAEGCLTMETISIWYFCLIFVAKLGFCIYERKKKLALQPWGPMDVICIMGGCTMVIPSVFAILEYFPYSTFPEPGGVAITLVAIFLPLSSIWAAATPDGPSPIFRSSASANSSSGSNRSKMTYPSGYNMSGARSDVETERKGSMISPSTVATMVEHVPTRGRSQNDGMGDADLAFLHTDAMSGVRVDRTYSVHSGRGAGGMDN